MGALPEEFLKTEFGQDGADFLLEFHISVFFLDHVA